MSDLRIAIIGAGPAGLTLARLLQRNDMSCTIFELESTSNQRNQGGSIDLHPHGGQMALREAGLFDEFQRHARPEGEAMKLVKYNGTVLVDENVEGNMRPEEFRGGRPEIDRVALRDFLLESVKPGTVHWNKKLLRVEASAEKNGKHDLHFQDGVEVGYDVVVGADGAWSKVRQILTDQRPYYSGISSIELWAMEVEEHHPWVSKYVGIGSCFMFDEGRAIQCQRNGNHSIRVYASVRQPETWIQDCGIDWSKPDTARKELTEKCFGDCADELKRLIMESNDKLIPRALYMLPVGVHWESRSGVTLVGDSAHLMTPFAGVGVNVAMIDALELAKGLIGCKKSLEAEAAAADRCDIIATTIREFEASMFKRGEQYAQKTYDNMQKHFSAHGGEQMAARISNRLPQEEKPKTSPNAAQWGAVGTASRG